MRHGTSLTRMPLILLLLLCTASGGCRQGPWNLWNAYAAHFIDEQGRVVDPQAGGRTTSQGQTYALFFALADNDLPHFQRVLAWTPSNPAGRNIGTRLSGRLLRRTQD